MKMIAASVAVPPAVLTADALGTTLPMYLNTFP